MHQPAPYSLPMQCSEMCLQLTPRKFINFVHAFETGSPAGCSPLIPDPEKDPLGSALLARFLSSSALLNSNDRFSPLPPIADIQELLFKLKAHMHGISRNPMSFQGIGVGNAQTTALRSAMQRSQSQHHELATSWLTVPLTVA